MRDGEGVARVLIAEEIGEVVEARPGDRREAERAGLMRGEEQAVARRRPARRGELVECVECRDLAVEERVLRLRIGGGNDEREIGFLEDRRAEELVAGGDAGARLGDDVRLR